jgi:hypothetical protein
MYQKTAYYVMKSDICFVDTVFQYKRQVGEIATDPMDVNLSSAGSCPVQV